MRIIAAMDIIDGACVRLTQGDYSRKTVYSDDPLEVARELEAHGIKYLHLVLSNPTFSLLIVIYILDQE